MSVGSEIPASMRHHLLQKCFLKDVYFFYHYHVGLSLLIHIKYVLWPCDLISCFQGVYCCQCLITSGNKVKSICKIWPLVFFNNVSIHIHTYKVFLSHALYFNLHEVTLQDFPLLPSIPGRDSGARGKSEFSHLLGTVHWKKELSCFLVPLLICHCGNA